MHRNSELVTQSRHRPKDAGGGRDHPQAGGSGRHLLPRGGLGDAGDGRHFGEGVSSVPFVSRTEILWPQRRGMVAARRTSARCAGKRPELDADILPVRKCITTSAVASLIWNGLCCGLAWGICLHRRYPKKSFGLAFVRTCCEALIA